MSGARLRARVRVDRFDSHSGYPVHEERDTFIDLSPQPVESRCFLGTELGEVSARELYELWLEREPDRIVAERVRYERDASGLFVRGEVPEGTVSLPLASPLRCTLSREMKEDDPALFQTLLDEAIRRGRNICADTDMRAEVWNGVVLQLDSRRLESNRERRVERWRVDVRARFGRAGLDYLVRLDEEGHSVAWCPVPGIRKVDFLWLDWPDVGSKVREGEQWLLNTNMAERGVVEVERSPEAPGGVLVHDEQVESVYEVLWAALAGYRYAVVHDNERWVFHERAQWEAAVARLESLRGALRFERG